MFAGDAAAAAAGVEELNAALQWVEGELAKGEGPFFMGKDFTLVRLLGAHLSLAGGSYPPVPQPALSFRQKETASKKKARSMSKGSLGCGTGHGGSATSLRD